MLWFLIQVLGWVVQKLPITALEISTIAFAILNVFMYTFLVEQGARVDVARGSGPIRVPLEGDDVVCLNSAPDRSLRFTSPTLIDHAHLT